MNVKSGDCDPAPFFRPALLSKHLLRTIFVVKEYLVSFSSGLSAKWAFVSCFMCFRINVVPQIFVRLRRRNIRKVLLSCFIASGFHFISSIEVFIVT